LGGGEWPQGTWDDAELAASQWGIWPESYGAKEEVQDFLIDAYVRRLRWEAKERAVQDWTVRAEVYGGGKGKKKLGQDPPKQRSKKPSGIMGMDAFLESQGLL
jgi:hypothetical protein